MSAEVLIVEDEAPKLDRLVNFVSTTWPDATIRTARSVRSAISSIQTAVPDLVLLDMSLPTFDIGPKEPGGRPQGFGGIEVLRYFDLFEIAVPTIVVTAYEAFSRETGTLVNHGELNDLLSTEHPGNYRGLVYYNSLFTDWRNNLTALIQEQLGKN